MSKNKATKDITKFIKSKKSNSFVLLGMSPKAVTIPRSETTLGAWTIFHFCVFLTDVSISCSMISEFAFTYWTFENSNAQGIYVGGWI